MRSGSLILIAAFSLLMAVSAGADDSVGNVKTLSGNVSIERDNAIITPMIGGKIFRNDALKTGADGSVGVVFKDDTLVSLGPDSRIVISEFLFSPSENKLSIVMKMFRGTMVYLSGIIAKLAPEAVRVETPVANIGVRGTKFAVRMEGNDPSWSGEQKAGRSSSLK
jgi:hypothetical protein